ncbi:MAG TPA: GAF domain-containing protein, partial [Blastocatellia bacterium]|nr:GAF domain-containing protein [Blastocatellia bacterium]
MNNIPAIEINRLLARSEELIAGTSEGCTNAQTDLRELLRRTKELAIELMRDNEQIRVQNLLLERQKLEAEQRYESSRLGVENEQLKAELSLLNTQLADLEKRTQKFRRRYEDIEKYNMALSNVYIAANQLHSTLDFSEVVKTAGEILWNLVASPVFAIFLRNEKTGALMLIGGEGIEGRFPGDLLPEPSGIVAEALTEGVSLFIDDQTSGDPLAAVPLKIEGRGVIGLITVYQIEEHKGGLSDLDKELFDLLASQTATALTSSQVRAVA